MLTNLFCIYIFSYIKRGSENRTKIEPKFYKYLLDIRMIYVIYSELNGSCPKPNRIFRMPRAEVSKNQSLIFRIVNTNRWNWGHVTDPPAITTGLFKISLIGLIQSPFYFNSRTLYTSLTVNPFSLLPVNPNRILGRKHLWGTYHLVLWISIGLTILVLFCFIVWC